MEEVNLFFPNAEGLGGYVMNNGVGEPSPGVSWKGSGEGVKGRRGRDWEGAFGFVDLTLYG